MQALQVEFVHQKALSSRVFHRLASAIMTVITGHVLVHVHSNRCVQHMPPTPNNNHKYSIWHLIITTFIVSLVNEYSTWCPSLLVTILGQ